MRDIDLSNTHAVCNDCARTLGFTPKDKAVGAWMGECGVCHQHKPCTELLHDWNPPKRGGHHKGKVNCVKCGESMPISKAEDWEVSGSTRRYICPSCAAEEAI